MLRAFVLLVQASPVISPDTCPALPMRVLCLLAAMIYSTNRCEGQVPLYRARSTVRQHAAYAQSGSGTPPGNAITASVLHDCALRRGGQAHQEAARVPGVSPGYARHVGHASPDPLSWQRSQW